jgi:2-dehydropantoate 2-reductase
MCVKMYDLEAAAELVEPLLGPDTWIMTVQNGIEAPAILGRRYGGERMLAGVSWFASSIAAPGRIVVAGGMAGRPWLEFGEAAGEPAGEASGRVEAIADRFRQAGIDAAGVGDAPALQWQKFCLISATSSAAALTRQAIGVVCADADMRWLLEAAVAETAAVARARGVALAEGIEARVLASIDSMPSTARPSQLTDLLAGKPLELDWLSGAVKRLGAEVGVATPYHAAAYAALKLYRTGDVAGGQP